MPRKIFGLKEKFAGFEVLTSVVMKFCHLGYSAV
jgi:hypothetical protein